MISDMRDKTRAVSAIGSPRPICEVWPSKNKAWPPSLGHARFERNPGAGRVFFEDHRHDFADKRTIQFTIIVTAFQNSRPFEQMQILVLAEVSKLEVMLWRFHQFYAGALASIRSLKVSMNRDMTPYFTFACSPFLLGLGFRKRPVVTGGLSLLARKN